VKLVTFDEGKVGRVEGDHVVELDVASMRDYFERDEVPRATGQEHALDAVRLRAPIVPKKSVARGASHGSVCWSVVIDQDIDTVRCDDPGQPDVVCVTACIDDQIAEATAQRIRPNRHHKFERQGDRQRGSFAPQISGEILDQK